MAETKATRLADLRRQKRDIEKAIRAEQGTARMEKDFAQQKSLTELKEKLEKQLQSHPLGT